MLNQTIQIRVYRQNDFDRLISLIKLNTPDFFAPEEEQDFVNYLHNEKELYYVVESDNRVIGCGGINFDNNYTEAKISWDILHKDYHRKSIGTQLLQFRINLIKQEYNISKITVRTSQMAHHFYRKNGFSLVQIVPDFWAKGYDLYYLEYKNVENIISKC